MDFLLEALTNWLKEMLVGGIMSNLSGMFDSVNQQVADISVQVGQTPQGWNGSIFSMIENLSNSIMVPIAGVILAIVMTVDLIQMIADKNNLHDVDTWMIFKWVFKSAAAILIVTNTWNIVMGVFDTQMPQRLEAAKAQLDNLYQQQAAAKEEVGKPFLYEEELKSKNARLVELDTLLNIDGKGQAHAEAVVAKSARPSVLDHLKRPVPPRSTDKKPKQHEEVR